jgi:predicted MFS family arabinose efflux permease
MSSFRALFARSGASRLALACALGWLSFASYGLAVVLAVQQATGSFATAGAAIAVFSAGSAILAPVRGRLVDGRGRRALISLSLVHLVLMVALAAGCAAGWPAALLYGCAGFAGAATPPLIATARARWPGVAGDQLTSTSHALNAALGDAGGVIGPAFTALVATAASPTLVLTLLGPSVALGAFLIAPGPIDSGDQPPLADLRRSVARISPALRVVLGCELAAGVWLGALDIALPALSAASGAAANAALPLSLFAVGSVCASLWSGTGRSSRSAGWRYISASGLIALVLPLSLLNPPLPALALLLTAVGIGYGLFNVAVFELIDEVRGPLGAVEAFTWLTTANAAGLAIGAEFNGLICARNPDNAFVVVVAAALSVFATGASARSRLQSEKTNRDGREGNA